MWGNLQRMKIWNQWTYLQDFLLLILTGNLLRDKKHKFEQLLEDQKLSKLCSDAGLKIVEKGQSEETSRLRGGWILGNTKIGPDLVVKVCLHQGCYDVEIVIESLFRDRTVYWVRIVNGINKYVTETSETISLENVEHRVTGKLVAKAKPRPMLTVTLSPISILGRERNWVDIDPERFRQDCFTVSKVMIRLLRHDPSIPQEDDGAARYEDTVEKSRQSSMALRNDQLTIG